MEQVFVGALIASAVAFLAWIRIHSRRNESAPPEKQRHEPPGNQAG